MSVFLMIFPLRMKYVVFWYIDITVHVVIFLFLFFFCGFLTSFLRLYYSPWQNRQTVNKRIVDTKDLYRQYFPNIGFYSINSLSSFSKHRYRLGMSCAHVILSRFYLKCVCSDIFPRPTVSETSAVMQNRVFADISKLFFFLIVTKMQII